MEPRQSSSRCRSGACGTTTRRARILRSNARQRTWPKKRTRRRLYMLFDDTPLFLAIGTHFAYVYVGTPPQRASVIINTRSHFTAFPCSGCKNCCGNLPMLAGTPPCMSSSADIVTCDERERCHGSTGTRMCLPVLYGLPGARFSPAHCLVVEVY